MARSTTASAFSDTECDGDTVARLQAPSPPAVAPAPSPPAPRTRRSTSPLSAVPAPPRLGRVSSAAACTTRTAQAEHYAGPAGTTPLLEAASPSSDRSETGFASCAPPALASASADRSPVSQGDGSVSAWSSMPQMAGFSFGGTGSGQTGAHMTR